MEIDWFIERKEGDREDAWNRDSMGRNESDTSKEYGCDLRRSNKVILTH